MATAGKTAEENKALVRRYIEEVWNQHNLDAIDDLVSPEYLNHAASTAEYQRGGARHAVEWLLSVFPDHRFEVEDAVADGETVAARAAARTRASLWASSRRGNASPRSSRTGSVWLTGSWRSTGR